MNSVTFVRYVLAAMATLLSMESAHAGNDIEQLTFLFIADSHDTIDVSGEDILEIDTAGRSFSLTSAKLEELLLYEYGKYSVLMLKDGNVCGEVMFANVYGARASSKGDVFVDARRMLYVRRGLLYYRYIPWADILACQVSDGDHPSDAGVDEPAPEQ